MFRVVRFGMAIKHSVVSPLAGKGCKRLTIAHDIVLTVKGQQHLCSSVRCIMTSLPQTALDSFEPSSVVVFKHADQLQPRHDSASPAGLAGTICHACAIRAPAPNIRSHGEPCLEGCSAKTRLAWPLVPCALPFLPSADPVSQGWMEPSRPHMILFVSVHWPLPLFDRFRSV